MIRRAVAVAVLLTVAWAEPAGAHSIGGIEATNYRTEITAISPSVPGLTVRLRDLGRRVEVRNRTGEDVIVLGYQDEPYLRVGPSGVFENRRSPSLFQNQLTADDEDALVRLPPEADPLAPPDWRRRGGGDTVSWPDHRVVWGGADPPAVRADPGRAQTVVSRWAVPLEKGPNRESVVVTGRITWIPGPAAVPWFAAAAVLFGLGFAAGAVSRWPALLSAALAVLLAADMVRFYGNATSAGGSLWGGLAEAALTGFLEVAAWGVGIWAIGAIQQRRAAGPYLAMAVGIVLGFISGVGDLLNLAYSQVPTSLPVPAARAAVSVCLGLGFGIVGGGFLALRRTGALAQVTPVAARS
ncbi:MAG: hypothetical protein ACLGI2_04975 [Acidimicrobiia bacterium]